MKVIFKICNSILFLAGVASLVVSCDKIGTPLVNNVTDSNLVAIEVWDDTTFSELNNSNRIVVFEEFTGHTCSNCPDGAREIDRIINTYPGRALAVSIHTGFFAKPLNNTEGSYTTDFRTDAGDSYDDQFGPLPNPVSFVSRKTFNNSMLVNKDNWESYFNQIKDDEPIANINMVNYYNDSLQSLKLTVQIDWLTTVNQNLKLQVFLIENKVIDWQKDGIDDVADYEHNHILRKSVNGTWGDVIDSNEPILKEYYLTINDDWSASNCEIVAFIYEESSYEIFQANKLHILTQE